MKIRSGFVSNSSSSSFCIFGIGIEGEDRDDIDEKIKGSFLKAFGHSWNYTGPCVGVEWCEIKDDETGAQFRERVNNEVRRIFGDDVCCHTIEESWYDG